MDEVGDSLLHSAVAIGNFDGVHRGHQELIKKAHELSNVVGILSFTPHPSELLQPNFDQFYLTSDEQKLDIFAKLGVDSAIIHRIDHEFLRLDPRAFVDLLMKKITMSHVVVGEDFTFGIKASGNLDRLKDLGAHQFKTHGIKNVTDNCHRISSSAIREYLKEGHLDLANHMLGRPFSLLGTVVKGQQKGRLLGFKTANIRPAPGFALKRGVYATILRHHNQDYLSVTNVGLRPTVTDEKILMVETHCLDQDIDLYGETIEIFFIERMRDEQKFASLTALQEQVQKDCQAVRQKHHLDRARFSEA
jgi:riboflavin kinase / FMN adenylyltransferase